MKRKLVKQGENTLVVSMPSAWIKANRLSKGDDVFVSEMENSVVVQAKESPKPELNSYSGELKESTSILFEPLIKSIYEKGFSEITIKMRGESIYAAREKKSMPVRKYLDKYVLPKYIGMEVLYLDRDRLAIKCFSTNSKEELDSIQRRVFLLIKEFYNYIIEGSEGKNRLDDFIMHHDRIAKFLNYYIRVLNMMRSLDERRMMYALIMYLDSLTDSLRRVSRMSSGKECSKRMNELIRKAAGLFDSYYHSYYNMDEKAYAAYFVKRDDFKESIISAKLRNEEEKILQELIFVKHLPKIILDYALLKSMNG